MKPRARLSHSFSFGACVLVCVLIQEWVRGAQGVKTSFAYSPSCLTVCLFHVLFEHPVSCQADVIDLG